MMQSIAGKLGAMLLVTSLAAVAAGTAMAQEQNSGFLRDYERLQDTESPAGGTVREWVSPELTPDNYNALLLDPIVYYPEPRPSEKVNAETLDQILAYANDLLRQSVSKRFNVVDRAGPGVVQIRVAFTSVATKGEGLKPYQYVPIAFVATMAARAASGGEPQRGLLILEVEATDSVTGKLLGMRTRVGTGERLAKIADRDVITLDTLKPLLDELAGKAMAQMDEHIKPK